MRFRRHLKLVAQANNSWVVELARLSIAEKSPDKWRDWGSRGGSHALASHRIRAKETAGFIRAYLCACLCVVARRQVARRQAKRFQQ